MKTEWRIFGSVALFLFLATVVYGWWSWYELGMIEWIGTVALFLSFLLSAMVAGYFLTVSRRIEPRPEDRYDAEVTEGAGEIGFFSPGSYYPFGIAVATAVTGIGVAFWLWWLIVAGAIGVIATSAGLLFEYHTGTRRTASQ